MAIFSTMIALALTFQATEPAEPLSVQEQTLRHFLWYDHPINQGTMACDRSIRRRQEALFTRRFNKRIRRLEKAYEAANGADNDLEVIPSLRCVGDDRLIAPTFMRGMSDFEAKLEKMEHKFGLVP